MNEDEKRRFWRKLLGYHIGEEVTITYEIPVKREGEEVGKGEVFLSGKVVGFEKDHIILETSKGVTIKLEEDKILDAKVATKEDKEELRLYWGESLDSLLKRTKGKA